MKLSVVIPVYNEYQTINKVVDAVQNASVKPFEIVIVDDASTDGTQDILHNDIKGDNIHTYYHRFNKGKGGALITGFFHTTGDVVIIQDADLEYSPDEYSKLIQPILDHKADVVYGSRFLEENSRKEMSFLQSLGNRFLTKLSNLFTGLKLSDMETCYKVIRTSCLKKIELNENGFGIEPELTAKLAKQGCRFQEVPISYKSRSYNDGKKIGWLDGVWAIVCIIRYNLFT